MMNPNIVLDDGKHDGQFALALELVGLLLFLLCTPFLRHAGFAESIFGAIIFCGFMAWGFVQAGGTLYRGWRHHPKPMSQLIYGMMALFLSIANWSVMAWYCNHTLDGELWTLWP